MNHEQAIALLELGRSARLEPGPEAEGWENRLAPRKEELAQAVAWFLGAGEIDAAVELAASVWRIWSRRVSAAHAREILDPALQAAVDRPPTRAYALGLYADGVLAFRQGKQEESRARNEAAMAAARAIGDLEAEALALVGLSRVALRAGEYERVCTLATRARALVAGLAPSADVDPLHLLAAGTRLLGDYDLARELYRESLALSRRLDDGFMIEVELHNLGHVEIHRGEMDSARAYFEECSERRKNTDAPYARAMERVNRAALACCEGHLKEAVRGVAEAERILSDAGIVLDPDDRFEVDWLRGRLNAE